MDEQNLICGYEQHETAGKIMGERKYSTSTCKGVEKNISCLLKRINKLESQRKSAYENTFKVKKKIRNQTNQIIKCYHERERNLLWEVDEALSAQTSSITEELSKLISAHASCQTLYANMHYFDEDLDVLSRINDYLCKVGSDDKSVRPLKFTSNFEQAKLDASRYGSLEGDFVGQNITIPPAEGKYNSPAVAAKQEDNKKNPCTYCSLNALQSEDVLKKVPKRERADSQDSFEIVDLLENISCKDAGFTENVKLPAESAAVCKQNSPMFIDKVEASTSAKCSKFEKQLLDLQHRLKVLTTLSPKLNPAPNVLCPVNKSEHKSNNGCNIINYDKESWLQKDTMAANVRKTNQKVQNYSFAIKVSDSPACLIKQAFSPYFSNESFENWLSK